MNTVPLELTLRADVDEGLPSAWFEAAACCACTSRSSTFFIEAEDDLTGRPGRFRFVRCAECGLVFQSPRLTIEHVKAYYDDQYIAHQERGRWGALAPLVTWAFGAVDRAKLRISRRYVQLDGRSSVLDVGC